MNPAALLGFYLPHAVSEDPVDFFLAILQEAGQEDIPRGPSAWCCTLDADVPLLLTVEEEEQYLERSRKAARNSCANLVPCPQPDCEGMAVVGQGETDVGRTSSRCNYVSVVSHWARRSSKAGRNMLRVAS